MKKTLLMSLAAMTLATVALAGPPKKDTKTAKAPATVKCAVMADHTVNVADATKNKMYADYKGNRYFFCCGGCPDAFKKDPAKYASAPHIKTPKEKVGKAPKKA